MEEFGRLAQDFVEATSSLVGDRTINIMSREGNIIASTEHHRIGDFHAGAAQVLKTGKPVLIKKENLSQYPGAKEGYNMPIFLKDQIIGVVGIFGDGDEVRDVANLLRVYVTQHFAQQQLAQKQNLESEMRTQLLRLLMLGDTSQIETIGQLSNLLDLQMTFPVRLALIYQKGEGRGASRMHDYSQLMQDLTWKGILDRRKDVCGIQKQDYVCILSDCKEGEGTKVQKLIQAATEEYGYEIAVSNNLRTLAEIPEGMKEVTILKEITGGEVRDLEQNPCKMRYLFHKALIHGGERCAQQLYEQLCRQEGPGQTEMLLITAGVYYQEQGSVTSASGRLHVHKNTLLYRMKRLYQLLELEEEAPFVREFLIRLLIQYIAVEIPEE